MALPKVVFCTGIAASVTGVSILIKDNIAPLYTGTEKLDDKVVIVTGANTGIGKEVVRDMAQRKAKVIMACRDMEKCETARREIVLETKNKYVYCRKCDLASQASIRKFVDTFKKEHAKLHILINNAGVMRCPRSVTEDGIETQLGVNHMGHFLLTNLLLDVLKACAPSRIVNVSSSAHKRGKIQTADLNSTKNYDRSASYAQSKLANILFTRELSQKLKGTGVTVNAVHPGIVDTDITRHMSFFNSFLGKIVIYPFFWMFALNAKRGAQSVIHAALEPSLIDESGSYFSHSEKTDPSEEAQNDKMAKWLWLASEKWTKLNDS